jgi:Domain of unknown function (DUF4174)
MTNLRPLVAALAVVIVFPAFGQANLKCQVRPKTLAVMRHCYRPLLVFSPRANDPRLKKQAAILDDAADDMMDRFVMLTPVLTDSNGYQTPLDTPYVVLAAQEMKAIRERFHVPGDQFLVLLLDEDGSEKLRSSRPVEATRLNALIDTMPTRKLERERPHAN